MALCNGHSNLASGREVWSEPLYKDGDAARRLMYDCAYFVRYVRTTLPVARSTTTWGSPPGPVMTLGTSATS
jgi:hypothetical protein